MVSRYKYCIGYAYRQVVAESAEFPAFMRESGIITHGEFWRIIDSFTRRLAECGVTKDSLIALHTSDMIVSLATLMASSLLGARFVVAGPILRKADEINPTHFFCSPDSLSVNNPKFKEIDSTWYPSDTETPDTELNPYNFDPDADWLYLHTSGTTGEPKYIALSQRMVSDRTTATADDFPFRRTTFAPLFHPTSRPFFARAIGTLMNAGALIDSPHLEFWAKAGVNFVCGSPQQLRDYLNGRVISPKIERLEVSGAKLTTDAARELLKSFNQLIDVYGAGETSKSFASKITIEDDDTILITGMPRDSAIEIISENGALCGPGEIGSVRVRNDYMTRGYLNAPEDSRKAFRDGWFYPGDIGTWGENGALVIIGRDDDVINLDGYKLNATLLDMFFSAMPGIREAIVFRNPKPDAVDRILVFVVFEPTGDRAHIIDSACEQAEKHLSIVLMPRSIRSIDVIPRTKDGAPDRALCQALVRERASLVPDSKP